MNKYIIIAILTLILTPGCKSVGSNFVEGVEDKIKLKWVEEWKPSLEAQLFDSLANAKETILKEANSKLELQEEKVKSKLAELNVKLEDFDRNGDGRVTGLESAELVAELKSKHGNEIDWYQILLAVIVGYGGTTAGKEWIKSKLRQSNNA